MPIKPTISVIVPVYNVEHYLDRCIQSILAQTYADFELLLIDDGSTDSSSLICEKYREQDGRVVYCYKQNGGLSDARNYGLERLRGEYVAFIDSDDWVESNYLEYLYDAIKLNNCDMSTCVFSLIGGNKAKPWKVLPESPVVMSGRDALISLLFAETVNVSAHGKLFRSSLFADISFPYGKHFEDVGTTYKLIQHCDAVAVGGAPLYNYFMRPGSITHSNTSSIFDRYELAKRAYFDLQSADKELNDAAERYFVFHSLSTLRACNLDNSAHEAEAVRIRKEVLEHKVSVLHTDRTPKRDKIALHILSVGLRFYQHCWALYAVATNRA